MLDLDQPSGGRSDIADQLMRVIQLADFDRPHAGSFIPLLLGIFKVCQERGHACEVIFMSTASECEWLDDFRRQGVKVTIAPPTGRNVRLSLGIWLSKYLGRIQEPTVLHTHFTIWDIPAMIAARRRAAVIWHVHSAVSKRPPIVARTVLKFLLFGRRTAGILCPAPDIARDVCRRMAPRARVRFVPSALDMKRFPLLDGRRRREARAALGLDPDSTVLSHFGWHWHLKGNDIFLEAVAKLSDVFPDLVAVDRGGDERMREYAAELGIADRFRLIDPVDDVQTVHGAADVLLSSSRQEGMAYAVLESLASGTPVAATAVPGHSFLGEHVDAIELSETSSDAVAEATRRILARDPDEREAQARQAHEWIAENLSTDAIGGELAQLYERAAHAVADKRGMAPTATKKTRRLIHLCDYTNEHPGSFVPMIGSLLEESAQRGWRPELVLIGDAGSATWALELQKLGFPIARCPDGTRIKTTLWLRRFLRERPGPTLLHTHFTSFDVPAVIAAAGRSDCKVVWHEHSALSRRPMTVARNVIKFGLLRRGVAWIYCPAPDLAKNVVRRLGPRDRTSFLPNSIDARQFGSPTAAERSRARRQLGLDESDRVALMFAWHWTVKGGELFQRAAALLARDPSFRAVQLTEAPAARSMARELGIDGALVVVEPTDAVRTLYSASDVFVSASRAEGGTPFAVLEALSSGLPVVGSDIPGHRFIAERVPGVVLASRSPESFAEAIAEALDVSPSQRSEMAAASSAAVTQSFAPDAWRERILDDYDRFLP